MPYSRVIRANWVGLATLLLLASSFVAENAGGGEPAAIVYSTKQWEGTYSTQNTAAGVKNSSNHSDIKIINADGSGAKTLITLGDNAEYPKSSPDGKWLYFQANHGGHFQVYRARPDGKQIENLSARAKLGDSWQDAFGYALSGDGKKMVYTANDGAQGQVVIANADGREARFLAPHLGYIYMAALNRTGDQVVFSGPAREYRLLVAKLPAGDPQLLTPDHSQSYVPQFTPDGKTIVFIRHDGDIYSVRSDGSELKRLTEGNNSYQFKLSAADEHGSSDGPDISPDGKRIAYISAKQGDSQLWVMDINGDNQRQLTRLAANCGRPQFSPDGQQVAFISFVGKYPQLFVVDAAGGEPRQLTHAEEAVYWIDWRLDGADVKTN